MTPQASEGLRRKHHDREVANAARWRSVGGVRTSAALRSILTLALAACASAPTPLAADEVAVRATPIAVARVENADDSPQLVHIAVFALRAAVDGPAPDVAAAVLAAASGAPFRGASGLPAGSVWLHGDAARALADRWPTDPIAARAVGAADAVLAVGLGAEIEVAIPHLPTLRLLPATAGGPPAIWPILADRTAGVEVHLRDALAAGDFAVAYAPAGVAATPTAPLAGHAIVLTVAPTAPTPAAVAAARAAANPTPAAAAGWPRSWRHAFAAVGEHNRRPPLLEIARTLEAVRARDLLLVADELALIACTERLAAEVAQTQADAPWPFERALWRTLLPRLERDELPPALHAACLRHLGAMADDASALRSALDRSADAAAFARAIRADNLDALADHDAAWRTRGRDWLQRQGIVVPDYDPLGDDDHRRLALRAFHAAEAAPESSR